MEPTVKINGKSIPCKDVLKIELVHISDNFLYGVTYREFEPIYHETQVLMGKDEGYALEKKVRKSCLK